MLKVLVRGIAALTVLAALAAACVAMAGNTEPKYFAGEFDSEPGSGSISFQLDRGKKPKVHDIAIDRIYADCADGSTAGLRYTIDGNTPVLDDRSFAVRSVDGEGGKAIVRGKFSRKFKSAKGTAHVYGKFDFNGTVRKCDSGKQSYVAKVVARRALASPPSS